MDDEGGMATAAELRAEAERLRSILNKLTDPAEWEAVRLMIDELEGRAKAMGNAGATDD